MTRKQDFTRYPCLYGDNETGEESGQNTGPVFAEMGVVVQRVSGVAAWNALTLWRISYLTGMAMDVNS